MNEHALRLLEFDTILREVCGYAWSEDGKNRLAAEGFVSTREGLESLRRPVAEFRRLFETDIERPALYLPDIGGLLRQAAKPGAALEAQDLAAIGSYLRQAKLLKNYIKKGGAILREEADGFPGMADLRAKIDKIIDHEGKVREESIPCLARLRRKLRAGRRELDSLAASYLAGSELRGYWQSDTASQKDGRMVLPLARGFRGRIKGVVHEISASGATAFFEPLDIFRKNNEMAETENEYHRELFRILKELTAEVGESSGDIGYMRERLSLIDSWQARAFYGRVHDCFPAAIACAASPGFRLHCARHPLLGKKAVPIDIVFTEAARILLITGPNTGGKTVALKTAGLFALMNQFGLEIPSGCDSLLPLFDDIFVDMGDEQSIAASLSTFSAHLANLAGIAGACTSSSLVLLDELGSGTDPGEGSAIAMAFLDGFAAAGLYALVTTHLGTLKHYAFSHEGVSNASVLFDAEALRPEYKIIPGVPGESHALEIAERCGVPAAIIASAKGHISRSETDSARLIKSLTQKDAELGKSLFEQRRLLAELEEEKNRLAGEAARLAAAEARLRKEGLAESRRFLAESRKQFEGLIHELRASAAPSGGLPSAAADLRAFTDELRSRVLAEEQKIEELSALARPRKKGPLREGIEVLVGDPPRRAVLERKLCGGRWLLATGSIRLTLPETEITPAEDAPRKSEAGPAFAAFAEIPAGESARFELDLRGLRAEEALAALTKQMDRAIMQGLYEFGVIHGKGEGILQAAVRDYLSGHPAVESFAFAHPSQGGTGKTFVTLKQ
jgi:DNA mismatch repair protein MutS2